MKTTSHKRTIPVGPIPTEAVGTVSCISPDGRTIWKNTYTATWKTGLRACGRMPVSSSKPRRKRAA